MVRWLGNASFFLLFLFSFCSSQVILLGRSLCFCFLCFSSPRLSPCFCSLSFFFVFLFLCLVGSVTCWLRDNKSLYFFCVPLGSLSLFCPSPILFVFLVPWVLSPFFLHPSMSGLSLAFIRRENKLEKALVVHLIYPNITILGMRISMTHSSVFEENKAPTVLRRTVRDESSLLQMSNVWVTEIEATSRFGWKINLIHVMDKI